MPSRFTRSPAAPDIDRLIKPGVENGEAVYEALARFGTPLGGLTAADFIERERFFRIGRAPVMVDILLMGWLVDARHPAAPALSNRHLAVGKPAAKVWHNLSKRKLKVRNIDLPDLQ